MNAKEFENQIEQIIAESNSADEAFDKICQTYPEINKAELKEHFDEETKKAEQQLSENSDSETVENLSEDDLESVAGGSFGSWMKKNWPYVVGGAVMLTVFGVVGYKGFMNGKARGKLDFEQGRTAGYNQTSTKLAEEQVQHKLS